MRRHGTNLTAVAAILGGTVLGAGATMALASAKHADRHGHGNGRQQTIIVCRSEGAAPTSASVTIEGTAGETSVTVTKQRPSRDRRHVRKRRRCRRIVTTDVSRHRDVSFEHLHAGATTPHFDRERVRVRLEEARRCSQAARERLQQAQARAEEVQARAGDVQAEAQVRAQEAQARAQQAQVRAQEAQAQAQVIREAMTELRGQAGSGIDSADLERLRALLADFRERRHSREQGSSN